MGFHNHYKKELNQKLQEEASFSVNPNAINEKKVKLWSYTVGSRDKPGSVNGTGSKHNSPLGIKPKQQSIPGFPAHEHTASVDSLMTFNLGAQPNSVLQGGVQRVPHSQIVIR